MVRRNKRGQEGFSFGSILGLVIGIIALVMIALFIYGTFDKASTALELLPGEEATASQICSLIATSGDASLICGDFKELKIGGKDGYVSCNYVPNLFSTKPEWAVKMEAVNCDDEKSAVKYCDTLNKSGSIPEKNVTINSKVCVGKGAKKGCLETTSNTFKKWDASISSPAPVSC